MFKVFITETLFQGIISKEEQRPVYGRSNLYRLLKQQPVERLSSTDMERIKSKPNEVLKHPSALYILDISHAEALAIQKSYGVMCLSGDNPDISPLIDINDIHTPKKGIPLGRGWDSVLDSVEHLPSNGLILTDRYLFSARNRELGDGLMNVQSILRELLPKQFEGDKYHITIVFCKERKHDSYKLNEIAAKLYNIARQFGRKYEIMVEVFGISEDSNIYDKLHSRRILSNYFMVEATHKLAAFEKNVPTTEQLLIPMALFTEGSLKGTSDAPLASINQTISSFKEFYKLILSQSENSTDYFYAVNGERQKKCMGIRNRLLK